MLITLGERVINFPWLWPPPPVFNIINQPPSLKNALVVGISQSGQSPDIVSVLAEGKRQGCLTMAITNEIDSPLGQTADLYLDVEAGSEKAVAATKTYTAQLTAIAMLSAALAEDSTYWREFNQGLRLGEEGSQTG